MTLNKCRQYAPAGPDAQPAASRLAGRRCGKRYGASSFQLHTFKFKKRG